MGHHVRAKFRCLGIESKYDGTIIAELKPVQQKGSNSKENAEFWSYSPNGESKLVFFKKCPIEVGAYYYIDMIFEEGVDDNLRWKQDSLSRGSEGGGEVYLSWYGNHDYRNRPEGMLHGYVKIGMEPKARGALEAFSHPGSKWKVDFTFAEPSDAEP
jgi:hypothetical protein